MKLDIATADFTYSKDWKTRAMDWVALVKRLSKTVRTRETVNEYHRLSKTARGREKQHKIKDVGGFVGGALSGSTRSKKTVLYRSLITLDLDNVDIPARDVWLRFKSAFPGTTGLMYSTHKHTPDLPRLRLILPMSETMSFMQYIPIARMIAEKIGINLFDHTTYQPERFMFWPSTPKDGEYFFRACKGEYLKPDDVLNLYNDWQDINEWPIGDKENKIILSSLEKQQDPTEKPGVIGAFCREFTIEDAIDTFLSNEYEKSDVLNRYTYLKGHSFNGLALYDNKFAYSHHDTDPAGQVLCNAFDLVRIHKYGNLDNEAKEGTPTNKLASYTAMTDFCVKNKAVRRRLAKENREGARDAFKDLLSDSSENNDYDADVTSDDNTPDNSLSVEVLDTDDENTEWMGRLEVDKTGAALCTAGNMLIILLHDKVFKKAIGLDLFSLRLVARRPLKWRHKSQQVINIDQPNDATFNQLVNLQDDTNRFIKDSDMSFIRWYIETSYKMNYGQLKLEDALYIASEKNAFHPIKSYLKRLEWDRVERIPYLFHDYLGAENSEYLREVSKIFFTAAVKRIYKPGCKFDYMPVLIGKQGLRKSSLIKALAGVWINDSLLSVGDKNAFELLQGSWIVEMAELSAIKRNEVESIKNFISKPVDKFRAAYGRLVGDHPRTCVFFGTSNNRKFLKDDTGNRRFWPIEINLVPKKLSLVKHFKAYDRDQVWAEAMHLLKTGQKLYLSDELELKATEVQKEFTEIDERIGMVEEYIKTYIPVGWETMNPYERGNWYSDFSEGRQCEPGIFPMKTVCAHSICQELFRMQLKDCDNFFIRKINMILNSIPGLSEQKRLYFKWYGRQRGYEILDRDKE